MSDLGSWQHRIYRVMDHIRDHPAGDHRLETLAALAHSSPFHFHRIFTAVAGETVAAFARRARLERAAYLMKSAPGRTLTAIAIEVGFPALAEFSRAFARAYGMPPSAWDRRSRLDQQSVYAKRTTPEPLPVRVVERPGRRYAYVRLRTHFRPDDLQRGLARLTAWLDARRIAWRESALLGMSWDHYETTPLDQLHYDLALPVPSHVDAAGDIGVYELPAVTAAEIHCRGEMLLIAHAWDYLYEQWLPSSGHQPADLPAMKRFRTRPAEIDWTVWDVDCSIALTRSGG